MRESKLSTGPDCVMSSALPAATPPKTSNRATPPSSLRPIRWPSVPPMLPAPTRAIFLRAMLNLRKGRPERSASAGVVVWTAAMARPPPVGPCGPTGGRLPARPCRLVRQRAHFLDQVRLPLETDAGQVGQRHVAVLDLDAIGEAAEGLEEVGVGLVASEPEAGRDVERHLVPAVRDAAAGGPAVFLEHVERAKVLDQAVAERAIELQPVAIGPHAAVADQVAGVLHREQVLAGRHRVLVVVAQRGLQLEVERVARLFVPEQVVLREGLGVGDGSSGLRLNGTPRKRTSSAAEVDHDDGDD